MYPSLNNDNVTTQNSRCLKFSKCDFSNASLICSTTLNAYEDGIRKMHFGFTAGNTFYSSESSYVKQIKFLHDQKILQIFTNLKNEFRMDVRYSSFVKLNFKIPFLSFHLEANDFQLELIIVYNSTPFFYKKDTDNEFRRVTLEGNLPTNYGKSLVDSSVLKIEFKLKKSEMKSFFHQLYFNVKCSITYLPMKNEVFFVPEKLLQDIHLPWEIQYIIEAIKSLGSVGHYLLKFYEKDINILFKRMNANTRWVKMYFSSMYEHLKNDLSLSKLNFEEKIQKELEKGFVDMKMVYITPTRVILGLEEAVKDCRGIRMLKAENLIQVKFRDENFSTFPTECVEKIFLRFCRGGINIAGRQFHEFGGSSSLFREHGSYFYATIEKTDIIRLWQRFGKFKIEAAAKVGARIGQYFTSAMEITIKVRQRNVLLLDDIMSMIKDLAGNNYCFSDGVGTISPDFAANIAHELNIPYVPSAFQIRYAGYKGMVFIDNQDTRLFGNGGRYLLCFRKSQQKFVVEDDGYLDFDIVNSSAPMPVNLFPVFTAMLDAAARCGTTEQILHERIRQLQYDKFLSIVKPLAVNELFIKTLKKLPQYFPISAMHDKYLIDEPFLRSMVEANAVSTAKGIMSKCQLPLPLSLARAAFGIMDPTGILNHGEIFFQYSEISSSSSKITGKKVLIREEVGVTKSPIYHAGDIRVLRAIDIPALHHLVDVVVFPSRGFRPHPDEIGGGDLDGDTYLLFWDLNLIPNWCAPAADYIAPSVDHIEKVSLYELQERHPEFRVQYAKENNLEQISTCHLAHLSTHQPFHADCTKIAKKGEISVNFFKSGLAAEPLEDHEKPAYWPKFMMKQHEPTFTNSHILSEFHERASSFYYLIQSGQTEAIKQRKRQVLEHIQITQRDIDLFYEYRREMNALMDAYQITSEGDLFANTFLDPFSLQTSRKLHLENERLTAVAIQEKVFMLFGKYRMKILNQFIPNWESHMRAANETIFSYQMPYVPVEVIRAARAYYILAEEAGTCFSFPWIIWEGLQDKWKKSSAVECKNIAEAIEKETFTMQRNASKFKLNSYILEECNSNYPWFSKFIEIIDKWLDASIATEIVTDAICHYMSTDLKNNNMTPGTNFIAFITSIAESKLRSINNTSSYRKLYEKAHSTLIKLAFLPEENILTGVNLENRIINYLSFVIPVPKFWSEDFRDRYYILKVKSGCQDVAIGLRRATQHYDYFTLMCRGTLEACRKMQALLTPVIEADFSISIADMKARKVKAMRDLLEAVFNFPTPLIHANTAPVQAHAGSKFSFK